LRVVDRAYLLEAGTIRASGSAAELLVVLFIIFLPQGLLGSVLNWRRLTPARTVPQAAR